MKKRIAALFCALALCLGLLAFPLHVGAASTSTPCFMAVNDTLLPLEDQYVPIAVDGKYYVPYTALDSSVTGVALGIFPVYNSTLNTLTVYNREQMIKFNLSSGTYTDRNGTSSAAWAVTRNGRIYVPAQFICEYFGLTYSSRITVYGPMVRIRSSSAKLDDIRFVDMAQLQMEERLREWRKAQKEEETPVVATPAPTPTPKPTPTPAPTPTPTSPSTSTSIPSSPPEEQETDKSDVHTYLSFRADRTDGLEELLAKLEQVQVRALFFFPAEELADYDDAVRSVLCGGHAVGLLVSGATAEEVTAQAQEGNRLLAQIAHVNTNTVLAPDAENNAVREEIGSAGLLCWRTDVNALPDGRSAFSQANAVLGSIDQFRYDVYILSDASVGGAALMGRLLPELIQDRYDLRLAVETEL